MDELDEEDDLYARFNFTDVFKEDDLNLASGKQPQHDNYWISEEQISELVGRKDDSVAEAPKAGDWKEMKPDVFPLEVVVDKSRRNMWQQGKQEVRMFLQNAEGLMLRRGETCEGVHDNIRTVLTIYLLHTVSSNI